MRNTLTGLLAAFIAISSCTPGSGTTTPATPSLNATETALLGKWYMTKEEQDYTMPSGHDTVLTTTSTAIYFEFQSGSYAAAGSAGVPDNYKMAQDARYGIIGAPVTGATYWFYDQTSSRLNIAQLQWEIVTQTATALVIKKTDMNATITQTFKK